MIYMVVPTSISYKSYHLFIIKSNGMSKILFCDKESHNKPKELMKLRIYLMNYMYVLMNLFELDLSVIQGRQA